MTTEENIRELLGVVTRLDDQKTEMLIMTLAREIDRLRRDLHNHEMNGEEHRS